MRRRTIPLIAAAAAAMLALAACGSSGGGGGDSSTPSKGSLTIGSANFDESELIARMYGDALSAAGYKITIKAQIGSREVYIKSLQNNEIQVVPEYVSTAADYFNAQINGPDAPTTNPMGSTDPAKALANLNSLIKSEGLIATPTSPAADENAFAVTNDFAKKNNLTTISDLAKLNGQLVLGGPAECPTRPYCELGLEQTYGLQFKNFVTTDSGGQVTYTALTSGQIQVGLVFSSDGGVSSNNLTVLTDDKHLQNADNIVGLMKSTVPADAQAIINKVNQALTTSDLQTLNKQMSVDKDSATDLAKKWVSDHKLS